MDFFTAQESARATTKWLVLLFAAAIASIIGLLYLAFVISYAYSDIEGTLQGIIWWQPRPLIIIASAISAVIISGTLYKLGQLSKQGGKAVAESLGGRVVKRSTQEILERRLLNVVDEMAIASGTPVPGVYLLEHEPGVNAFAAGSSLNNAVVAVTQGALEQLSRDELQGVIAHEFSHILNGDMRINFRLIGLLHGLLLLALAGRMVLRGGARSRSKNSGGAVAIGLSLYIIGYIGIFFGNLIKAAVSRQREFLADASAVQYTRNPDGIGGALNKLAGISGSLVKHANAEEASHLFFGEGIHHFWGLFATHPPLQERIKRIDPRYVTERSSLSASANRSEAVMGFGGNHDVILTPAQFGARVGTINSAQLSDAERFIQQLPEKISLDMASPEHARAIVYALLVVDSDDPKAQLMRSLKDEPTPTCLRVLAHLPWFKEAGKSSRLPLLELTLPTLAALESLQLKAFLGNVDRLIQDDQKVDLYEYLLNQLLGTTLGAESSIRGRGTPTISAQKYRQKLSILLSMLARIGHKESGKIQLAFEAARQYCPIDGIHLITASGELTQQTFEDALQHLSIQKYSFRKKVIEACVAAISADDTITVYEAELLRLIGLRFECPVPPLYATVK